MNPAVPPLSQATTPQFYPDPADLAAPKPFVLFDMNGVLVSERVFVSGAKRDSWKIRPGIEALLQLTDKQVPRLIMRAEDATCTSIATAMCFLTTSSLV